MFLKKVTVKTSKLLPKISIFEMVFFWTFHSTKNLLQFRQKYYATL